MQSGISVIADCKTGICYRNAHWITTSLLAVEIPRRLRSHARYELELGRKGHPMRSIEGVALPVTAWTFSTQ